MFASGRTDVEYRPLRDHPWVEFSDGRWKAVSSRSFGEVIEQAEGGNALFTMIEKRIAIKGFSECHVAVGFLRRKHFLVIWISLRNISPYRTVKRTGICWFGTVPFNKIDETRSFYGIIHLVSLKYGYTIVNCPRNSKYFQSSVLPFDFCGLRFWSSEIKL